MTTISPQLQLFPRSINGTGLSPAANEEALQLQDSGEKNTKPLYIVLQMFQLRHAATRVYSNQVDAVPLAGGNHAIKT